MIHLAAIEVLQLTLSLFCWGTGATCSVVEAGVAILSVCVSFLYLYDLEGEEKELV